MLARRLATAVILWFIFGCLYRSFSADVVKAGHSPTHETSTSLAAFPRKIWQTWEQPAQSLDDELQALARTWVHLNPNHRYELLTGDSAITYVRDRFPTRPDIVQAYESTEEAILRADLLRYLMLLADGGVYADIDTHCTRPIDEWVPAEYASAASLIVGLEYDAQGGELRGDFGLPAQICQWTFMAKPNNEALQHVVDRVVKKLDDRNRARKLAAQLNVVALTGPEIFTKAILESLRLHTGERITYENISNLLQPKLIGDVLIMPISAFGSGQQHSGSKDWGNDEQLMSHHWFGLKGWTTMYG